MIYTRGPGEVCNCLRLRALQVRDKESNIDNLVDPIEDMYSLLKRYEVAVPKEESDMVSDLHYSWRKLRKLATEVSNKLAKLQVGFKRELIQQVNSFVGEAKQLKCVPSLLACFACARVPLANISVCLHSMDHALQASHVSGSS